MNKKTQVLGIFLALSITLTTSMILNRNVFAQLLPVTPPITSPITPPTPTATSTASPTATPNSAPVIVTSSLRNAVVRKFYSMTIVGYDVNISNPLGLNVKGLPSTMTVSSCQSYLSNGKKFVQCTYTGKPKTVATYKLVVSINDYSGAITKKTLTLKVVPQ